MKKASATFCLIAFLSGGSGFGAVDKDIPLTPVFALTRYLGVRTFMTPQAICVDGERGDIYVADTGNGRIVVFNSRGQLVTSFKHRSDGVSAAEPVGVAVDKIGQVYVTDSSSHVIHIYDGRGRPTGTIKPAGADADVLFGRMTVDSQDNLLAVSRNKGQIFVYDSNRVLIRKLGGSKEQRSWKWPRT